MYLSTKKLNKKLDADGRGRVLLFNSPSVYYKFIPVNADDTTFIQSLLISYANDQMSNNPLFSFTHSHGNHFTSAFDQDCKRTQELFLKFFPVVGCSSYDRRRPYLDVYNLYADAVISKDINIIHDDKYAGGYSLSVVARRVIQKGDTLFGLNGTFARIESKELQRLVAINKDISIAKFSQNDLNNDCLLPGITSLSFFILCVLFFFSYVCSFNC